MIKKFALFFVLGLLTQPLYANNLNQIKNVHAYVNISFGYASDESLYGQKDYWATPDEFLALKMGDCEDFAIKKYSMLKDLGIKSAFVYFKKQGVAHVAVLVSVGNELYVSDIQSELKKVSVREVKRQYQVFNPEKMIAYFRSRNNQA